MGTPARRRSRRSLTSRSDRSISPAGTDKFSFAGEIVDSPTGLVYLSARYYDPAIGRFYALDPIIGQTSAPQTLNRYVYCVNSPLIHTDPIGRFWNLVIGAVGGAIVGGAMAYITGGNVWAGAAGGAVEGTLLASGVGAIFAGVAGSATQTLIETGGNMDAVDVAGIGMGAVSVPGGGGAARRALHGGVDAIPDDVARITTKLEGKLEQATKMAKLTDTQLYDIAKKGGMDSWRGSNAYRRHMGTSIDKEFRDLVRKDSELKDLVDVFNRGERGRFISTPDVRMKTNNYWWDVTTPGQWNGHASKYERWGQGIPLTYNI